MNTLKELKEELKAELKAEQARIKREYAEKIEAYKASMPPRAAKTTLPKNCIAQVAKKTAALGRERVIAMMAELINSLPEATKPGDTGADAPIDEPTAATPTVNKRNKAPRANAISMIP